MKNKTQPVITYRAAYTDTLISLCEYHDDTEMYALGPVVHGRHAGRCVLCDRGPMARYIGTVDPITIAHTHYDRSTEVLVTLSHRDDDMGYDIDCISDYTDAERAAIWAALEREEGINGTLPDLSPASAVVHVVALKR